MFDKITILGVGLLGASFALAVKKKKLARRVTGFSRTTRTLMAARDKGIIDDYQQDPGAACDGADLVLLSTPVGVLVELARRIVPSLREGAVITDVGSVKGALVSEITGLMPDRVAYIGSHPIAGSDRSGIEFSTAELFTGAKCVVTPTDASNPQALERIIGLWKALGSVVITMSPGEHDRIYGAVSHFPHLLAYGIVNTIAEVDPSYISFCGQGFRDATRIAGSSPELWRDICMMNRDNLLDMIARFQDTLEGFRRQLVDADAASLEEEFRRAQEVRRDLG